ncbi:MAG: DUF4419 domain-containing protein [Kineosporiaceae bacterium]
MVVFPVDDVAAVTAPLPTRRLGEVLGEVLAVGCDADAPVLEPDGVHPLLSAVGRAFAEHRPLVLTPDSVWLTISQGVAQHVRLHAEELRAHLVNHPGRKRLTVTVDQAMPQDSQSWGEAVEGFADLLAAEIGYADLFECDFSTSTSLERIAGRVTLLDAYSPYYTLWMVCVCGIPWIRLTGTVADWQKIRDRVDVLTEFGLHTWCRSLAAITDQFVRTASGDVDTAFWQRIYNPADAYGGEVSTGWAARLYPYLTRNGIVDLPNPLLDLKIGHPRAITADGDRAGYTGPGIRTDQVPATLSQVRVNVNDRVDGQNRSVTLHAGLVAVAQDPDGALCPMPGWYLTPATVQIGEVIDRLIRDHPTTQPSPEPMWAAPAELLALHHRIGSASLFNGTWRLRPPSEHRQVWLGDQAGLILAIIDTADGRSICAFTDDRALTTYWVACRVREEAAEDPCRSHPEYRLLDNPTDVPVYGTSLALLLDAALDSHGDITHLQTGHLDQLLHPADPGPLRPDPASDA